MTHHLNTKLSLPTKNFLQLLTLVLAIGGLLWLTGCGGGGSQQDQAKAPQPGRVAPGNQPAPFQQKPQQQPVLPEGNPQDPVVTIGDTVIKRERLDEEVDRMLQRFKGRMPDDQLQGMRANMAKRALDNIVTMTILNNKADAENITVTDERLKEEVDKITEMYGGKEKFMEQLNTMNKTWDDFRDEIRSNLRIQELIETHASVPEPTEADMQKYYEDNKQQFEQGEQVQASHILLTYNENDSDEKKAEQKQKMEGILKEIKGGADFAKLAEEHSACRSGQKGGDLGFFGHGRMVKPFEEAAFNMKVGEISDIVETKFGVHIIKVTDKKEARTIPFEEAKDTIVERMQSKEKQQKVQQYIAELKEAANIKYAEGFEPQPQPGGMMGG